MRKKEGKIEVEIYRTLLEEPGAEIDETAVYREQQSKNSLQYCHISQRILTVVFSFRQFIFGLLKRGHNGCEKAPKKFLRHFPIYVVLPLGVFIPVERFLQPNVARKFLHFCMKKKRSCETTELRTEAESYGYVF